MRVVLTGASGFIGGRLCQWLHAAGWEVVAIGRRPGASVSHVLDLLDVVAVREAIAGADALVHAAAVVPGRGARGLPADNLLMARGVGEACVAARVPLLVNLSSTAVYGMQASIDQHSRPSPDSAYGHSKLQAEQVLADMHGLAVTSVRVPLVYAAGMGGFYGRLLRLARAGVPLPLAHMRTPRTCIGRDNLCALLLHCLERLLGPAPGRGLPASMRCGDAELSLVDLLRAAAPAARLFAGPNRLLGAAAALLGRGHDWQRLCSGQQISYAELQRDLHFCAPLTPAESLAELTRQRAAEITHLMRRVRTMPD